MPTTYKVHVVRLRLGCFRFCEEPRSLPSLVCPLCALETGDGSTRTATWAVTGHIECQRCLRLSAIATANGVPLVPGTLQLLTLEKRVLQRLMQDIVTLGAALAGSGELLNLVEQEDAVASAEAVLNRYRFASGPEGLRTVKI